MPEINLPTSTKQDQIKTTVDAIKLDTTQIKLKVNEPIPSSKVLKSKVFETDGTFRVPAGVTEVYVTGCGGGGGGGGGALLGADGKAGGVTSFGSLFSLSGGSGGPIISVTTDMTPLKAGPRGSAPGSGDGSGASSLGSGGAPASMVNSSSGTDQNYCGSGGGGASYVFDYPVTVTPNALITVTIGLGGAGGSITKAGNNINTGMKGGPGSYGGGGGGGASSALASNVGITGPGGNGGEGLLIVKWWD